MEKTSEVFHTLRYNVWQLDYRGPRRKGEGKMTKKSKDNQKSTEVEKMTPALLMRSWNKTMEGVEEAKELNRQSGVPNAENFIQWPGYIPVKKYLNFIEATVNESTGEFRTLDNLIAAGEIQKSELKFYPKTYR